METPPVSPEIKPIAVNGSAPVNILVIDSVPTNVPSATIFPLSSTNCNGTIKIPLTIMTRIKEHIILIFLPLLGRRLVPVTPLRSQNRKNCIIKVPGQDDKSKLTNGEGNALKTCDKNKIVNNIPLSIASPVNTAEITKNLVVAASKPPVTLLSANQVGIVF